jgi:hypothetical protein
MRYRCQRDKHMPNFPWRCFASWALNASSSSLPGTIPAGRYGVFAIMRPTSSSIPGRRITGIRTPNGAGAGRVATSAPNT